MSSKVQQSVCSDCVTYAKSRIKFNTLNTFNNVNKDKMIEWIGCHSVGISSKTMWCAIMGVKCREADVPGDADDFSRCYDLYRFCELTQADLQKVANIYPYWRPIIDQWDELCEMYVAKNYGGVNERLNAMFDEIMKLRGYYEKTRQGNKK